MLLQQVHDIEEPFFSPAFPAIIEDEKPDIHRVPYFPALTGDAKRGSAFDSEVADRRYFRSSP